MQLSCDNLTRLAVTHCASTARYHLTMSLVAMSSRLSAVLSSHRSLMVPEIFIILFFKTWEALKQGPYELVSDGASL